MVPGAYTTANFLLDFYLGKEITREYLPFDELYYRLCNTPGAQGVVIHECRFTYEKDGLTMVRDLGGHWENRTGFPVPLGVIIARERDGLCAAMEEAICRSLDWAENNPQAVIELCRKHARETSVDVIQAHINLYVNEFSRDMGEEGKRAIEFLTAWQALGQSGES
jgi:1,4-dihydroxy-6-naphthoate synthase